MITESTIYWITRLDSFHNLCTHLTVLSCFLFILAIGAIVTGYDSYCKEGKLLIKAGKITGISSIITIIFSALVFAFIPTTKEMCAIKVIPMIMNNEKVQTIGNTAYDLTIDWMNELKPKTKTQ